MYIYQFGIDEKYSKKLFNIKFKDLKRRKYKNNYYHVLLSFSFPSIVCNILKWNTYNVTFMRNMLSWCWEN